MARMYPERLPADVESGAERRLFEAFRTEFSDDFVVFSQVRWLARLRRDGAEDGEADFVVAHPRYGALVLEVKGGGVARDAQSGRWTSVDSKGREHEIKDPFKQASRSMYALRTKLRDAEATRRFEIPLAYAVAMPDVRIEGDLGVDAPEEVGDRPGARAEPEAGCDRRLPLPRWHARRAGRRRDRGPGQRLREVVASRDDDRHGHRAP